MTSVETRVSAPLSVSVIWVRELLTIRLSPLNQLICGRGVPMALQVRVRACPAVSTGFLPTVSSGTSVMVGVTAAYIGTFKRRIDIVWLLSVCAGERGNICACEECYTDKPYCVLDCTLTTDIARYSSSNCRWHSPICERIHRFAGVSPSISTNYIEDGAGEVRVIWEAVAGITWRQPDTVKEPSYLWPGHTIWLTPQSDFSPQNKAWTVDHFHNDIVCQPWRWHTW